MAENTPTLLKCPSCGAPLDYDGRSSIIHCKFCGCNSVIPNAGNPAGDRSNDPLESIRQLISNGNINGAIEQYRTLFGVGAGEAGEAVDAITSGRMVDENLFDRTKQRELNETIRRVKELIAQGNKIEAIKAYRETFDVSLAQAKYAVDQISGGNLENPTAGFIKPPAMEGTPPSYETNRPVKKKKGGCIFWVIFIVLAIAGVLVFLITRGTFTPHYSINNPDLSLLLPSGKDTQPEIAAVYYNADADKSYLGLIDTAGKLAWSSQALDASKLKLASSSGLVYAASQQQLLAYSIDKGTLAWQTVMNDALSTGETPIVATASRVIVLTGDQTISAYDSAAGNLIWSRKLKSSDRTLRLMGSSLVVLDSTNDNSYFADIYLLDPLTGKEQMHIAPTCTIDNDPEQLGVDDGLVYLPADNNLLLVYGDGCVQRYDLSSGNLAWSTTSSDRFDFSSDGLQYLMADSTFYFSNNNQLLQVNLNDGTMKTLLDNKDYKMFPLAVHGNSLIVEAERTQGSTRFELWSVDTASGNTKWQINLQVSAPISGPDSIDGLIADTDTGWAWHISGNNLELLTFSCNPNLLKIQSYDLDSGNVQGNQTAIKLGQVIGDFYGVPAVMSWIGDVGYLNIEGNIDSIDLTTNKITKLY